MHLGSPARLVLFCALVCLYSALAATPENGESSPTNPGITERDFTVVSSPLFQEFCFKCHSEKKTKAHLNLQRLSAAPDFAGQFKTWEKITAMLQEKEMPPEDEPQPTDSQRQALVGSIKGALENFIQQEAGDPGRIAMRRLTSAEFAYSIQDLTGLDLGLERNFISDAVGGEGFSNVGDVQFIQDSTLQHYLEAARIVASHAIIGAGPLRFGRDEGKTGQELSAIRRINAIYQEHGFRTASGEGGKAYGLEHYPKALYAVWRFEHRKELGLVDATLASLAHDEGLDAPFVEHISRALRNPSLPIPGKEIVEAWNGVKMISDPAIARDGCEKLYDLLQTWQTSLAENTGDAEVASVVTETSFHPSLTNSFRIGLAWPTGTVKASFQLTVSPVASSKGAVPVVVWREPHLRFRKQGQGAAALRRQPGVALREFVTEQTGERVKFGTGQNGQSISTNSFVTAGSVNLPFEFSIPDGAAQAELTMEAQLDLSAGDDCVVRCVVSHQLNEGATAAASGVFSLILANPNGANIEQLKAGIAEFARTFPQISQREAAPADRDPIPAPFDNSYNNVERNEFHATLKYFRDDKFLTEHVLEDSARRELDRAWTDLHTSFDYHNVFLTFVAKKYRLDRTNLNIGTLTQEQIDDFPEEPRRFVQILFDQYRSAQEQLQRAESGHVEDALRFAQLAWRRPLMVREKERLRSFYSGTREGLDHPGAIRALITRILVSPAFLYRIEMLPGADALARSANQRVPLSNLELASRLSYFLWGSIPDEELCRAAAVGKLTKPEHLVQQAQRMLRHPKARRFATEFFGQWFGFYRFDGYRGVDTTRFGEFTDDMKESMYDEAVSFFEHIVREDRPVHEILFADYAFLNRDLASHYGIDAAGLPTNSVSKVEHVGQFHRGGLLRLGAVLTSTSAPLRTSAVKRGDWILRRVLGKGVPPPPGDAGSIPPDDVLADGKTVRERLEAHRRDPSCVNCHARMDPFGFALEHFDSIGRWRDTYRDGQKIDATGKLNDGTEISEFEGLDSYLRANEAQFNRTLCAKLIGFALGRSELVSDRPLIDQMSSDLKLHNRFSRLVAQIVASPQFRYRRAPDVSQ